MCMYVWRKRGREKVPVKLMCDAKNGILQSVPVEQVCLCVCGVFICMWCVHLAVCACGAGLGFQV